MEPVVESKSPKRELEEVTENESINKKKFLDIESNGELKCPDQVEKNDKDEMSIAQPESNQNNEDIKNYCETAFDSEPSVETQKEILCSASKDIVEGNNNGHKNTEEKSNDESNLQKDSENLIIEEIEDNKNERSAEVENNGLSTSNQEAEQTDTGSTADENQVPVQNADQASSSSTQIPIRDKCKYGSQCYRLNVEHKAKFSHPGDADYDEPDNRLECPYGILCYRKNPQHKLDYKHTQTKRKRTQNTAQGTGTLDGLSDFEDSMEESVDESEYDDSFIDDDEFDDDEFDSDLEFDDMDDAEDDENSDDEDGKKKRKKKKNGTKEQKKKKTKND